MQAHNLFKECLVFIVFFMPDDIIGKQAFAFFRPLFGHACSDGCLITMVALHGTAKASGFRCRNHHDGIKPFFQSLFKDQCRLKQDIWSILFFHPLLKVDEQGGIKDTFQIALGTSIMENQVGNKLSI